MAAERRVIDVEDLADFVRLVEEVRDSQESRVIRRAGEAVAVISPLRPNRRRRHQRVITEGDLDALRSAAGSWGDHIDIDKFLEDVYAARDLDDRPPVEL